MNDQPTQSEEIDIKERPSRARYNLVHATLERKWRRRRNLEPGRMMQEVIEELWEQFSGSPYSWCGFYRFKPGSDSMVLGPHRDKPACSPLPLHGVCGKTAKSGEPVVVPDVKELGDAHVECDPRNVSEVVVPVFDRDGEVWAVLDVDSEKKAAFDEMDVRWLERILKPFRNLNRPSGKGG